MKATDLFLSDLFSCLRVKRQLSWASYPLRPFNVCAVVWTMDKAGFNSCFEISPKPFLKTFLELNETIPTVLYLGRESLGN